MELYVKYRPTTTEGILGNDLAIKSLRKEIEDGHHVFLLTGNSGCGKTTTARAIANELGANELTIHEINVSDDRGIGLARTIKDEIQYKPIDGKASVYILDEIHNSTKDFQEAILKILEDCPPHVYFFLATTNPEKLLETIRNRCSVIQLKPLEHNTMLGLLRRVAFKEGVKIDLDVLNKIADLAEGSSRKGLKILGQVLHLDSDEERVQYLEKNMFSEENQDIIELCRALIAKKGWDDYVACMEKAKDDVNNNPEGVRRLIMSYARSVIIKGANPTAALMLQIFCQADTYRNGVFAIWDGLISFVENS